MWENFEPDKPYSIGGRQVAFSKRVLRILQRVDLNGKHLKAIEKGRVAPRGRANGLVPSELKGYAWKTKVLGSGGDVRVHGKYLPDGTLLFNLVMRH